MSDATDPPFALAVGEHGDAWITSAAGFTYALSPRDELWRSPTRAQSLAVATGRNLAIVGDTGSDDTVLTLMWLAADDGRHLCHAPLGLAQGKLLTVVGRGARARRRRDRRGLRARPGGVRRRTGGLPRMTHVIVTGASSGIGRALVREFVGTGAAVTAVARRGALLQELVDELGAAVHPVIADLSDPAQASSWLPAAVAACGPVDVLVNNAGVQIVARTVEILIAEMRAMFEVDLLTPLSLIQAVLPEMIARDRGAIVNLASARARADPGHDALQRAAPGSPPRPRCCAASCATPASPWSRCTPARSTRRWPARPTTSCRRPPR
ncbi:MAG: SDR family NAD(P)-dependent oxidoreductase [Nannocystaceae bacterium]